MPRLLEEEVGTVDLLECLQVLELPLAEDHNVGDHKAILKLVLLFDLPRELLDNLVKRLVDEDQLDRAIFVVFFRTASFRCF